MAQIDETIKSTNGQGRAMGLFGITDWICNLLESQCTTPTRTAILKPFYHTACFFHLAFCKITGNTAKNSMAQVYFTKNQTMSKCTSSHYFADVFGGICTPSCNITHLSFPSSNVSSDPAYHCEITDYFKIWLTDTSSSKFTALSWVPPQGGRTCDLLHWCHISDYINFWWSKFCESWCLMSNCKETMLIKLETNEVSRLGSGKARLENWIRNYVRQHLGIEWPRNVSFREFLIYFCALGGITLYAILYVHKRYMQLKPGKELRLADINPEFVQMFMDVVEKHKTDIKNLEKVLELNKTESNQTIENLITQVNDLHIQLSKLTEEHLMKQQESEDHTCKLGEYETKISDLKQQINVLNESLFQIQKQFPNNAEVSNLEKTEELEIQPNYPDVNITNENPDGQATQPNLENVPDPSVETALKGQCQKIEDLQSSHEDTVTLEAFKSIEEILNHTNQLKKQIEHFSGSNEDTEFLHLNELLIRDILKLDDIESTGKLVIRKKRRDALDYIQSCINLLNNKVVK